MGLLAALKNFFVPANEQHQTRNMRRNETCWCGSGKKHKKCCLHKDEEKMRKFYSSNCRTT
jgi:uncharacterized protein YecA (UPF0149 family)